MSKWDDVLELFQAGYTHFGALDIVLANAGVNEIGSLLKDEIDSVTGKLLPPPLKTLDVNLVGIMYTTKCAVHYFAKMNGKPCQLVLTGSAARYARLIFRSYRTDRSITAFWIHLHCIRTVLARQAFWA